MRKTHYIASGLANFFGEKYAGDALRVPHDGRTIPVMTIGEAIRVLRKLAGMNQTRLAERMGDRLGEDYAQSNISRIESGAQFLNTQQLQIVAEILNVRASDIVAMAESGTDTPRISQYLQAYSKLSPRQIDAILALADDE